MTRDQLIDFLAKRGLKLFPISGGKKSPPLLKNWPEEAVADPLLFDFFPADANIGIHCEGLVVLDVDVRHGGLDSLAALRQQHALPRTMTTRTPTGGVHLFYRLPQGHAGVANSTHALGNGIDVKSTRGYVVAPGSRTPNGVYELADAAEIAPAPEWLLERLAAPRKKAPAPVHVPDAPAYAVERAKEWLATRPVGDEAYATACGLRDFGLSADQALQLLEEHDGRPAAILAVKVEHAYRYAQNPPGTRVAMPSDFDIVPEPAPRRVARPLRLSELAERDVAASYLVKGVLQQQSQAVLYGQPGAGKTFVALDMAYCVASGRQWMGRNVHQGAVLYLAYEGVGGLTRRAKALRRKYGDADVPLYVDAAGYNLREAAGRKELAATIKALPEKPKLIVIDTFARALSGGDENSAQDVGLFNQTVGQLIEATGATVLIIHHSGKNKALGARGSNALLGATDTELEVDERQIITRKQRDIELAAPIGFRLTPVVIGVDADGEELSSCFVDPVADGGPAPAPSGPPSKRSSAASENERLGLDVLEQMSPGNQPVPLDAWRRQCKAEFLPERTAAAAKSFYKLKTGLLRKGLISLDDNLRVKRTFHKETDNDLHSGST